MRATTILIGMCLLALSTGASAAVHSVGAGQTHTTYATAYTAAVDGDTIMFMDAGPHEVGGFLINKTNLTVMAAPGVDVLINHTGARQLDLQGNAGGLKFGSNHGGRITIDGRSLVGNSRYVRLYALNAGTITIENVTFKGIAQDATSVYGIETHASYVPGVHAELILRNVEMDANATRDPSIINSNGTQTYVQLIRFDNLCGSKITLERCYLRNVRTTIAQGSPTNANSWGTLEFRHCDIDMLSTDIWDIGAAGASRYGSVFTNASPAGKKLNIIVHDSVIRANHPTLGLFRPFASGDFTVDQSVLVNGAGGVVHLSDSTNLAGANYSIQRSDMISTQDLPSSGTLGKFVNSLSTQTITLALTQCNLYGAEGSSVPVPKFDAAYTMDRCNDYSATNAYAPGWVVTNSIQPGQNPQYGDPANLNYKVGNATLLAQDIGANRDYTNVVPVELSTFTIN